ncbi:MAG TPA: hypothetical protein VN033_14790 [Vulgatibacter sp.]|nr:hypothetical protein [Vulgatibacter sp.]
MRRALLPALLLALLCACEAADPPPGEVIGGFRFEATMESGEGEGRCRFSGAPAQLAFEGVLSYERDTGKLWLTTGETSREGRLEGSTFHIRTPAEGPGVGRRLSSCTCQMQMVEEIDGELLAAKDCGDHDDASAAPEQTCPELVDGEESWRNCGCVRGSLRESVEFPATDAVCTCDVGGQRQPAPERCVFEYRLEGTLM